MHVWLITIGEPVPVDGKARILRTGILADTLRAAGHEVTWWASTFDHNTKRHHFGEDTVLDRGPGDRLILLHGPGYAKNVSLARIRDHRAVAARFRARVESEPRPDVILCSFPTIELSEAAVRYGRRHGVPVIIDVRDLWPNTFLDAVPRLLRPLGRLALTPLFRSTRYALTQADHLVAMSDGVLQWGLRYAGREAGPHDRVFPLAYRKHESPPEQVEAAAAALRAKGVDPSKSICWFLGMFGWTYDVGTVIDGARLLAGRGATDVQFVISGDGDRRAAWEERAKGLDNVLFTGWLHGPEIRAMMAVAKVGLAAYSGEAVPETLPNKLFEYLSAGLPVVSSLRGAEPRALLRDHDCGLTYEVGDAAGFAGALQQLLTDEPRRRRMGEAARRLFETTYDARIVYPRMADYLVERAAALGRAPAVPAAL